MHRDTRILQAGYEPVERPGAFVGGPQFSATYTTPGSPSDHELLYGRFQNPTWTAWEAALAELEGGAAVAFASGMAAIAAVFGVCLKPRDIVVLPSDCYYTTRVLASSWLTSMGIDVRLAATRENQQAGALDGARLLGLETPANPQLDVCDIRLLVDAAHAHGTLVAVDNTTATAYLQQPLALGADYVVASRSRRGDPSLADAARRDSRPDGNVARPPLGRDTSVASAATVFFGIGRGNDACIQAGRARRVVPRSCQPSWSRDRQTADARIWVCREL